MSPEALLAVDTAPHLSSVSDDVWDDGYNCAYSADGSKLLDAENFPNEVVVRPGCRILCDGVFAFQDYMAENDHFGKPVPEEERASYLDKVKLPDTLTHIGREAFRECAWLRSIRLPKNLAVIGPEAFRACYELETIACPAALLSIGDRAFRGCSALKELALPKALRVVGDEAFFACANLEKLTFPASLVELRGAPFVETTGLVAVEVAGDNPAFMSNDGVLFSAAGLELLLFPAAKKTTEYVVPEGVATLPVGAFQTPRYLTQLTIPPSVTTIENGAIDRRLRLVVKNGSYAHRWATRNRRTFTTY